MIEWGINALNHGSSLAVFENGQLLSNEYCHGDELSYDIIARGLAKGYPRHIYWYEQPWLKKARQLRAGQWSRAFDLSVLPRKFVNKLGFKNVPITYTAHHASHAAAGYYSSDFDDAAVIVLDAIGEFESATIWRAQGGALTKVWSRSYPHSLGLFYSAFTQFLGMTPIKDEGLLESFAAKGNPRRFYHKVSDYFTDTVRLKYNLHRGVVNWPSYMEIEFPQDEYDLAAAVQRVFEEQIASVSTLATTLVSSDNLVFTGGCAFNRAGCKIVQQQWNNVWTPPNPGDATSSVGAVVYHTKARVKL
jgi:carbamoyltransferase